MESICYDDIETDFKYVYNQMNYFIVGSLIYGFGLTISAWCISRCLLNKDVLLEITEDEDGDEDEEELYEEKYPLANIKDLSGNKPMNTTIIEHTPDGTVIMCYNYEKEGFEYWSDSKNITYDYLETVARKFVKMNFCCDLYIDRKDNIKKQNEKLDQIEKEEKEEKEKKEKGLDNEFKKIKEDDSVFVKSKISVRAKQKKEIIDRSKIAATSANKYIRTGKCSEFIWLKKIETKKKKISFNEFKNKF